jgi:histidyl-tRNA synthetase
MSEKKSVYKPKPVSGFPEWLPEVRLVEQQWLDHIRKIFESYGYCSIETPAVEELNVIQAKGGDGGADVDKEVYIIERLHREDGDKEARLALHFDQTVPLARYVAQHFNDLIFPFKRYQMQKVWRGERPQSGRFREFYQCDIDVINVDNLPPHFDAEMPAIIWEILTALPGMQKEKIQLQINNRKILLGLFSEILSPLDQAEVLRVLDKRDKLPPAEFQKQLDAVLKKHLTSPFQLGDVTNDLNELFEFRDGIVQADIHEQINLLKAIAAHKFKSPSKEFHEGLEELVFVMQNLAHLPPNAVVADFFMVRGLDYYTGTVYETRFIDDPGYGSICSGGRYDDLAGNYINKHLPGVGISIGFSRLFDRLRQQGKLPVDRVSPTDILVTLMDEEGRAIAAKKAKQLRELGFNVELFHKGANPKKQFEYAEKKGIPFVFVPKQDAPGVWEVKNMQTREQKPEKEGLDELEKFRAA